MEYDFHGGHCCGMRHIRGMTAPTVVLPARGAATSSEVQRVIKTPYPEETSLQRFDRFIRHAKAFQSRGIIEVVLAQMEYLKQYTQWNDLLLERGFKLVTESKNSNTANTIYVYHLVTNTSGEEVRQLIEEIKAENKAMADAANATADAAAGVSVPAPAPVGAYVNVPLDILAPPQGGW